MKKILSLLALLVMTLTAFATDYTGHRTVTFGSMPSTESDDAVLTITDNGDNTFNVTFKDVINVDGTFTDNYGTYTFSNVAGTTENGVTTIDLSNLSASVKNCAFYGVTEASEGVLFAKFNAEKAYARFSAKIGYRKSTISAEFGVDDFESTGGGEPGGGETKEKYTVNFDKGAKSTHNGRFLRSFSLQQTGKEKQTESVSVSRAAYEDHTSKVFTVEAGSELTASFNYSGEWMNGYVYIDRDNDGEFSYKEGQWDQAGTDLVAYSFYSTLANPKVNDGNGYNSTGASVTGDARSNVNPPSFTAPTEPGTYRIRFKIDWNCILPGGSNDILSDGGGVWDATLEVVAAEPEVVSTLPFENVAYTTSYNEQGTANVTFTEMSDGTFPMTFVSESLNVNAENLTKGTDEKGRTTYTGTAKRTDLDVTFTVNAVVYGEAAAQKLYMTMDNGQGFVVTVGEDPDYVAPVTYKNTLKVVRGTDTKTYENAEVSVLAKGENKYAVTIPSFSDMDELEGTIGKLTFEATGVEENGTLKLTATSAATTQEGGSGWDNFGFTASMDATVTGETLAGTFTVVCPDDVTNYTYTLYYGVEPPVAPDQVDVVEEGFKATGESWKKEGVAIDWDTQYIAAKLDLSTCEISSGPENVLAVGTDITGWNDGPHYLFFYNKAEKILQYNYLHSANKSYNKNFANLSKAYIQLTDEVVTIEISKQGGLKINGESALVKYVDTASSPSTNSTESWTTEDLPNVFSGLWALNTIDFGGCQGEVMSNATYKYVKVVPLGWTEPTEPTEPEVTVEEEKSFTDAISKVVGDVSEELGQAQVSIKEMTDKTISMTLAIVGQEGAEYTASGFTKTVDTEKNRTTYTGSLNVGGNDFDVTALVYTDGVEKLYMVAEGAEYNYVIGTNPDAPKEVSTLRFENVAYTTSYNEQGTANVTFTEMSDGTFPMTFVSSGGLNVNAENLTKGTDEKGRTTYTGTAKRTDADVTFIVNAVVYGEAAAQKLYMTMDNGQSFIVTVGEDPATGINATTVAEGEFEVFSVDGVKLSKLQKGLNIVRSADGKVKKVLVK